MVGNEMCIVTVKKTENPDNGYTSEEQLLNDTQQHRNDVYKVLAEVAAFLERVGVIHDWTKIEYFDDFSRDVIERIDERDFKKREWYKTHTTLERHHVNANVPDKVNLFDLLEMQADCIVAGVTRSGTVDDKFLEIPDDVLKEAYWNTVDYLKEHVQIEE